MIDRYSSEKIYNQIAKAIEIDIQDGFESGDIYLSEKVLTEKFGVNRHTVRRAIEELVKQGLLEKRHGLGTFVTEKRLAYRVQGHERLTDAVFNSGLTVETILINKQTIFAKGGVADALQLKGGDAVIQINTLRKIEGKAVCIISHFFPVDLLQTYLETYEGGSLGFFLKTECDFKTKRISSLVSSSMPNSVDSFHLDLATSVPILKVKTLNEDEKTGRKIEYSVTRFRSDMIQLEILMNL